MVRSATPLVERFWSDDRHTRIRLQQWLITVVIYAVGAVFMMVLARRGVMAMPHMLALMGFNLCGVVVFYALIRSGYSRRLADPSLTQPQVLFGIANVVGCYAIAMEARGAMLYPLMLIFTFGAFQLDWKRIAALTVLSLLAVGLTMVLLHQWMPGRLDPMVDASNFLMASIMMPGNSVAAAILGRLRMKLRSQRGQLELALERIQELASRDALTGLFNRGHAELALGAEIERSQRGGQPLAVALVDLDHFKGINDRHGHAAGDAVLKAVAALAQRELRTIDLVARWGGEEFLILMPNTTAETALVGLERLRSAVAGMAVACHDGAVSCTLSAGIGQLRSGDTATALLGRADAALYCAKAAGRNRLVVDETGPLPPLTLPVVRYGARAEPACPTQA